MGFARCGVEGNLRKFLDNTRKKPFRFYFFVNLKKRKWFLLGAVLIEILGVKAPPSQSRFPLYAMLERRPCKIITTHFDGLTF